MVSSAGFRDLAGPWGIQRDQAAQRRGDATWDENNNNIKWNHER